MENQQVFAERLFGEALDLPREERAAFLAGACRDTPAVRQLVEALLVENDRLSGFLSDPPYKKAETLAAILSPGTRLGRFTIVDQLGAGGMGVVYRARDEKLEREVAIKMVSKGVLASEEARRHFRREALALAKLNHAHIAAVYDVGEQDGADFLVMELVEGQSLAAKLRVGPLKVNEATVIARQVADALGEAHEHGVIHRDLKPANVMITPKGDAKVLDFGLAKLLTTGVDATMSVAETRGLLGTPVYMSPEQALGKSVDARADLWSLGVLYFESLVGRPPFAGNNSLNVLHAITATPTPSIRTFLPELPPLAEHIVNRALEKDCDLRYQRAAEMETDLKRLSRDLNPGLASVSSVSVAGSVAPAEGRRGRRGVAMVAGLVGLLFLLAVAYVLRPTVPPPRVIAIKQITHDGKRKMYTPGYRVQNSMVTDGLRVYFQPLEYQGLRLVSAEGGESAKLPVPFDLTALIGLSRSKSELLLLGPPNNSQQFDSGGLWTMPVLGGQTRRIGDMVVLDATWSPDGASIYYGAGPDIWVSRSDGSQSRKILTVVGEPNWIRFSPDGRLMRFGVRDEKRNTNTLWEARADGSGLRRLLSGDQWPNECCGSWTQDGKYFVFASTRSGAWNLWVVREKQDWWRKTNTEPVELATGASIAQSPLPSLDGKSIYFIGITKRGELERFDSKKGSFVLYLPGVSANTLAFTRDGSRIAYTSLPEGKLWVSKSDGSEARQLTFAPLKAGLPRWSPDGKQIVFAGAEPGKTHQVYMIQAEGGNPERLTNGENGNSDPSWSPDSDAIALGATVDTASSSTQHPIQILNLKSHQLTALPDSGRYWSPRWSPDGRWIVAIDSQTGALGLFNFSTQKWEELTKLQGGYEDWSRDSECVYFFGGANPEHSPEYRVCLNDRRPQLVADLRQIGQPTADWGGWSGTTPDGSILAVRDTSLEEIYSLELDLP
ncbi:MAG TPA: protein kinase [Terracidiphilus sp.]|nr:protein kinase [Terracidiphilus sp.]